jgi:ATP-dependent DNA ligase
VLEDELMGRDLTDDGLPAWTMVKERGWEGLVAKDPTAPYIAGSTQRWLKVKVRHEGQFIVGGVMRSGARSLACSWANVSGDGCSTAGPWSGACSARWSRSWWPAWKGWCGPRHPSLI